MSHEFLDYVEDIIDAMDKALDSGKQRIIDSLVNSKVNYINLTGAQQPVNLNTINDYKKFVRKKDNVII